MDLLTIMQAAEGGVKGIAAIGAGLAAIGAGIGVGRIGGSALESMAGSGAQRRPAFGSAALHRAASEGARASLPSGSAGAVGLRPGSWPASDR